MSAHPLDLIGIDIGGCHFYGCWKIDDHFTLCADSPSSGDRITNTCRKFQFCPRKTLRGVFQTYLTIVFKRACFDHIHPFECKNNNLILLFTKNNFALCGRGRVVEVNNRFFHPLQRFKRFVDQMFTRLHQHLNCYIIRNKLFFHKSA